jgi:hypothetical protein
MVPDFMLTGMQARVVAGRNLAAAGTGCCMIGFALHRKIQ